MPQLRVDQQQLGRATMTRRPKFVTSLSRQKKNTLRPSPMNAVESESVERGFELPPLASMIEHRQVGSNRVESTAATLMIPISHCRRLSIEICVSGGAFRPHLVRLANLSNQRPIHFNQPIKDPPITSFLCENLNLCTQNAPPVIPCPSFETPLLVPGSSRSPADAEGFFFLKNLLSS